MDIDVEIEDPRWQAIGLAALVEQAAHAVVGHAGLEADLCVLSVLACDDSRIAELNGEFRDKAKATNVLSWPAEERAAEQDGGPPAQATPDIFGTIELGDLALAYETCVREAAEQQKTAQAHVFHLVVHGILHLLGYDHIRDGDAGLMEALEIRILESHGVANPYEI